MHYLDEDYEPIRQPNAVNLGGVPQIPDWLHQLMQRGGEPTEEQEREAAAAIEKATEEIKRRSGPRKVGLRIPSQGLESAMRSNLAPKKRRQLREEERC